MYDQEISPHISNGETNRPSFLQAVNRIKTLAPGVSKNKDPSINTAINTANRYGGKPKRRTNNKRKTAKKNNKKKQ